MKDISYLVRPHLFDLETYRTARDEFQGDAVLFLDANENPRRGFLSRYPDPIHKQLRLLVAKAKGVASNNVFVGNGSDEAIDLLIKIFCETNKDEVAYFAPTYGMYAVAAAAHGVKSKELVLNEMFEPNLEVLHKLDESVKLLFLCNPNNPTGNVINSELLVQILKIFSGIVVVDEAYIDFSNATSSVALLDKYPQLVVLQTFSKAWGLAGARLGIAIANPQIIEWLNKVKLPYHLNSLSTTLLQKKLDQAEVISKQVAVIKKERKRLQKALAALSFVDQVFPSEANFLLVRFSDAHHVFHYLLRNGIVVRNRSSQPLLNNCLRITIGTVKQNKFLLDVLKNYMNEESTVS